MQGCKKGLKAGFMAGIKCPLHGQPLLFDHGYLIDAYLVRE
jgi:hypothetical protein